MGGTLRKFCPFGGPVSTLVGISTDLVGGEAKRRLLGDGSLIAVGPTKLGLGLGLGALVENLKQPTFLLFGFF